jgi:phenylacetate-CoA ligase
MAVPKDSRLNFAGKIDQFLVGRIAFPAVNYVLNRKDVLKRYRMLLASELYSKEALSELQFQRLLAVLRHVSVSNPFYAKRFKQIGLAPEDIKSLEDLRRIPPLGRQDVVNHRLEMVDSRYRDSIIAADRATRQPGLPLLFAKFRKNRLIRNTTTGSTGTPTIFYDDGATTALNWVHELRLKQWFGLPPGVKEARLTGVSTAYGPKSMRRSVRKYFWNQMMLPGLFLSVREHELSLQRIRVFKPRVLWGATQALTGLARYIQRLDRELAPCHPELVISWAAPLYEHEKTLLTQVFGCPVTNIYGSREVGHVAMLCPHGSMHANQENYILEVEGAGASGENAGPGNILVTQLNPSAMPFLRYRIGDMVELGDTPCTCGRSLGVLKNILGRIGDVYTTRDGRLIEPGFWCHAFMVGRQTQDVEKFQVVYRPNDKILFRIIPRRDYSQQTEEDLRALMRTHFPPDVQFEFEYVSDIKPQPSGKCPIVVNEIAQEEKRVEHLQYL